LIWVNGFCVAPSGEQRRDAKGHDGSAGKEAEIEAGCTLTDQKQLRRSICLAGLSYFRPGSSSVATPNTSPGLPFHPALVGSQFMSNRPPRGHTRTRGPIHTIIVVAVFLALSLFVHEEYFSNEPHPAPAVASRVFPAAAPSDDEIYTGSILFPPHKGDICHQFLFDNRNGRFTDNGNVDCGRAEGLGAVHYSTSRLWAISRGFH
jgi:hypothetical protein